MASAAADALQPDLISRHFACFVGGISSDLHVQPKRVRAQAPPSGPGGLPLDSGICGKCCRPVWPVLRSRTMNIQTINKCIIGAAALLLLVSAPAFAKTLKLPSDEFAVASIDFPSSWEPEEINNGVAGESPDKAVYLAAVAVGNEKGMNAELEDTFDFLKEHNVQNRHPRS
jgi:hypothetical protein